MSKPFTLSEDDKCLRIQHEDSYEHLNLLIDFDDVDHTTVKREAKRLLALLNEHAELITK